MKNTLALFCALSLLASASAFASKEGHPAPKIAPQFEHLKALVGDWKGKTKMGDKEEEITVSYKLTSAGTALVETMGAGTPHEMVSVYATDGKDVKMTHYCAAGNQPIMTLTKADPKNISLEVKGNGGLRSIKDMHMHAVNLTIDGDKLSQEWTNWEKGKKAGSMTFNFTRE